MKDVLAKFVAWSKEHAGAPCPDISALAGAPLDPWNHPFAITCTDQPGEHIAGAISSGPDGARGTADDIASWQLAKDVTEGVRGARWVAAATTAKPDRHKPVATKPAHKDSPPAKANPPGGTSVQLDENGLPISR